MSSSYVRLCTWALILPYATGVTVRIWMPVAAVQRLKKAASWAAVYLPPRQFTYRVGVWAIVRSVMMRGPKAAATPALCKNLLRVRWKCHVVFICRLLLPASRCVTRVCDDDRIRL